MFILNLIQDNGYTKLITGQCLYKTLNWTMPMQNMKQYNVYQKLKQDNVYTKPKTGQCLYKT